MTDKPQVSLLIQSLMALRHFCLKAQGGDAPASITLQFENEDQAETFRRAVLHDPYLAMMQPPSVPGVYKLCGIEIITTFKYPLKQRALISDGSESSLPKWPGRSGR